MKMTAREQLSSNINGIERWLEHLKAQPSWNPAWSGSQERQLQHLRTKLALLSD